MLRLALLALLAIGALVPLVLLVASRDEDEAPPAAVFPQKEGPFRADLLPKGIVGKPAPEFELADARGGAFSTSQTAGRPYVVTFLYTDCTDICPVLGRVLREALLRLGSDSREVDVLAISVDPVSDTPAAARRWLRELRQPDNFHYLIGSRQELDPVWKRYFVAPQPHGLAEGRHTANIWLVDRRGRWRAKYSGGAPIRPADVAHDLKLLLAEPAS